MSKKIWKGLPSYDILSLSAANGIDIPETGIIALDNAEFTADLALLCFQKQPETAESKIYTPDENSIFFGKNVVFTGKMSYLTRAECEEKIKSIGGNVQSGVNAKTDFLIIGQQDFRIVGADGMSGKQEKAMQLLGKGQSIEIMSEDEFLKNI